MLYPSKNKVFEGQGSIWEVLGIARMNPMRSLEGVKNMYQNNMSNQEQIEKHKALENADLEDISYIHVLMLHIFKQGISQISLRNRNQQVIIYVVPSSQLGCQNYVKI